MKLYMKLNPEQFKTIDWQLSCLEVQNKPAIDYIRIDCTGEKYEYNIELLPETGYYYAVTV